MGILIKGMDEIPEDGAVLVVKHDNGKAYIKHACTYGYSMELVKLPAVQPDHNADVSKRVNVDDCISRRHVIDAMKDMYRAAEKWLRDATDDVTKARAESCMATLMEIKLRIDKTMGKGTLTDDDCMEAAKSVLGEDELPAAQPEIIRCKDCKHWRQQTNYQGAPLSFGFCESDNMWRSLYGETTEVSHIDTDDDFYCGYVERRIDDKTNKGSSS